MKLIEKVYVNQTPYQINESREDKDGLTYIKFAVQIDDKEYPLEVTYTTLMVEDMKLIHQFDAEEALRDVLRVEMKEEIRRILNDKN